MAAADYSTQIPADRLLLAADGGPAPLTVLSAEIHPARYQVIPAPRWGQGRGLRDYCAVKYDTPVRLVHAAGVVLSVAPQGPQISDSTAHKSFNKVENNTADCTIHQLLEGLHSPRVNSTPHVAKLAAFAVTASVAKTHLVPVSQLWLHRAVPEEGSESLCEGHWLFISASPQHTKFSQFLVLRSNLNFEPESISSLQQTIQQALLRQQSREDCEDQEDSEGSSSDGDSYDTAERHDISDTFARTLPSKILSCLWTVEKTQDGVADSEFAADDRVVVGYKAVYSLRSFDHQYLTVIAPSCVAGSEPQPPQQLVLATLPTLPNQQACRWAFQEAQVPNLPLWSYQRGHGPWCLLHSLELSANHGALVDDKRPDWSLSLVGVLPLYIQESLLVNELLLCFSGVSGHLLQIKWADDESAAVVRPASHSSAAGRTILYSRAEDPIESYFEIKTHIDENVPCDPSLRQMVEKILNVARIQRKVAQFTEWCAQWSNGCCLQAFGEIGRYLLAAFLHELNNFEMATKREGTATLQRMWFFLQNAFNSLQMLEAVVDSAREKRGGNLLSALYTLALELPSKDRQELVIRWLVQCSAQWTQTLFHWMLEGELIDPHGETFIVCNPEINYDAVSTGPFHPWWSDKYKLDPVYIPAFLSFETAQKILATGRYVAALHADVSWREGMSATVQSNATQLLRDFKASNVANVSVVDQGFVAQVNALWRAASTIWSVYLREDCHLKDIVRSLHNYVFGGRVDYLVALNDRITVECTNYDAIRVKKRLQHTFQITLDKSTLGTDLNRSHFFCGMSPCTLRDLGRTLDKFRPLVTEAGLKAAVDPAAGKDCANQLAGVASSVERVQNFFAYFYPAVAFEWPFVLIWTPLLQVKMQAVSRLLIVCRTLQWGLERALQFYTRHNSPAIKFDQTMRLAQTMLHFFREFNYYLSAYVVEPFFEELEKLITSEEPFDNFLVQHDAACNLLLHRALASDSLSLRCICKIMTVGRLFHATMEHYSQYREVTNDEVQGTPHFKETACIDAASSETEMKYRSIIKEYTTLYSQTVDKLFKHLQLRSAENDAVGESISRLVQHFTLSHLKLPL